MDEIDLEYYITTYDYEIQLFNNKLKDYTNTQLCKILNKIIKNYKIINIKYKKLIEEHIKNLWNEMDEDDEIKISKLSKKINEIEYTN